jgi:hypothetical protein
VDVRWAVGTVLVFLNRNNFALEDVIGSHACWLEASMHSSDQQHALHASTASDQCYQNCVETLKAIVPAIMADLYGTQAFGKAYGVAKVMPAIGGFLFSAVMTARLYEAERIRQGDHDDTCYGKKCFETAYLILAGLYGALPPLATKPR